MKNALLLLLCVNCCIYSMADTPRITLDVETGDGSYSGVSSFEDALSQLGVSTEHIDIYSFPAGTPVQAQNLSQLIIHRFCTSERTARAIEPHIEAELKKTQDSPSAQDKEKAQRIQNALHSPEDSVSESDHDIIKDLVLEATNKALEERESIIEALSQRITKKRGALFSLACAVISAGMTLAVNYSSQNCESK